MRGQSRLASFTEASVNITIGFLVALLSQIIIFPLYGIHVPLSVDVEITLWFTLVSLARGYIVRRWFNKLTFTEKSSD